MDTATSALWSGPLPGEGVSGCFVLLCYIEISVFYANSVDPIRRRVLHCLQMSLLLYARHKCVKLALLACNRARNSATTLLQIRFRSS